jgi:hypothetical protein
MVIGVNEGGTARVIFDITESGAAGPTVTNPTSNGADIREGVVTAGLVIKQVVCCPLDGM